MNRQIFTILLLMSGLALTCNPISRPQQARASVRGRNNNKQALLPSNMIMAEGLKPYLENIWRKSRTFRQQCRQIAQAQWLRISLKFEPKPGHTSYRALSTLTKTTSGVCLVTVRIFLPGDYIEMRGHEFEHLLEQIEAVDLKAEAGKRGSAVYQNEDGFYETARAISAGRKVLAEYRGWVEDYAEEE